MHAFQTAASAFCIACICAEITTLLAGAGWAGRCIKAVAGLYILVILFRLAPQMKLELKSTAAAAPAAVSIQSTETSLLQGTQERLEADLCDTGSSTGDPCDISLLGGRCQYTVPADAGCRTGRSFNRDSTTVFSGKCTDDGAIYKRRTAGNVLSNYIPSATGWSQFHQYEKNCKNR